MQVSIDLLQKYNVPVPRYTSYPTVPVWKDGIDITQWKSLVQQRFQQTNNVDGISLYIHLPFCESLCTYCGCNKKITTNHSVEEEYMQALIKEWQLYLQLFSEKPVVRELHLGGGTPTFFSPANLQRLLHAILKGAVIHPQHQFSFEGHPNNTTKDHLKALYDLGFRRVSYGVQDHDPEVQRIINRIQPFENVQRAVEDARAVGYQSVNVDLIYGLPLQTIERMQNTIRQTIQLQPDRIAFYSYAHVPWTSRGQRLFDENDLPSTSVKMQLYRLGKELFTRNGYVDIGMDHFALPEDELYKAREEGWLYRNFMGYTTQRTGMLIGLGVSSISDAGIGFAQNHKTIHEYYEVVANGELPVTKGYFLNEEDSAFRRYILDVSCNGKTDFKEEHSELLRVYTFPELEKLEADGLVEWDSTGIDITPLGRHFIRNICKAFDLHLLRNENASAKPMFSKAI
ncbi:MAG: oxygen-independent coproporphyrinogen III oxidase [Bacteroidota bacterium]|nr:oxygen-independent coproporphyrinogen III oxidase [Bacteroidota bacterium]